jgi:oleate hydratase
LDQGYVGGRLFRTDIEKSNFIMFFPTIQGERTFFDYMEANKGDKAGSGGGMTIVDSPWIISFVLYDKYFPSQSNDVNVFWPDGRRTDVQGTYVKKPMRDCTGAEMFVELMHHCGMSKEQIDRTLTHSTVSTSMMPYITSQFMPCKISDQPKVTTDGCVNLSSSTS